MSADSRTRVQDDFREMLKLSAELLNEVFFGMAGYVDRVDEMRGNFPGAGGGGGGSKGSHSDPTAAGVTKRDPGATELADFRRDVRKVFLATKALHERWAAGRTPTTAPPKMKDPGCQLCNTISAKLERMKRNRPANPDDFANFWSETYCSVDDASTANDKGEHPRIPVCYWCYRFSLPKERGGAARLPNIYDLVAHAQGRRVMRSA